MFPRIGQFKNWFRGLSLLRQIVSSSLFALFLGTLYWLFPDDGKRLGDSLRFTTESTMVVPGNNAIERQLNLAKIEGISATTPSADFIVGIPFARPVLPLEDMSFSSAGNYVALSNASPLKPIDQDIVFAPGKCRFIGTVRRLPQPGLWGEAAITTISCVLDNGDYYGLGRSDGPVIGFLTSKTQPEGKEFPLVEERDAASLPRDGKYLVRFFAPLRELPFKGKTAGTW